MKSSAKLPTPELIAQEKARRTLLAFTQYTKPDYEANWHHRMLAEALDQMITGDIRRLIVSMPPRHGKSELVSRRFPAYVLGRDPDTSVISTSYSATLASAMNRDVQRIIDDDDYHRLFPNTTLSGDNVRSSAQAKYLRNSDMFEIVGNRGSYVSAGVSGGITGMGAQYAIVDDPIKNRAEAESETYRDRVYDWFSSTLYPRLEKDARILVTMTRWHGDDLAGRLLASATGESWMLISLPAIAAEPLALGDPRELDEALWPDKYDAKQLEVIKSTVGSYDWSALYQQSPSPAGGAIIEREWLRYYKAMPSMSQFNEIVQSWDLTFDKGASSDYVVGQVWGRIGADKYLLDQVRDRMSFTGGIQAIRNLSAKWPSTKAKFIENAANGPATISTLKRQIPGLIPVKPRGQQGGAIAGCVSRVRGRQHLDTRTRACVVGGRLC